VREERYLADQLSLLYLGQGGTTSCSKLENAGLNLKPQMIPVGVPMKYQRTAFDYQNPTSRLDQSLLGDSFMVSCLEDSSCLTLEPKVLLKSALGLLAF